MANISQIKLPSGETYGVRAPVIPYGEVDNTSTSTAYTATVSGISELVDGTIVMLKNGVVTSASGFTINVNGLGAKPVYNSMATGYGTTAPTRDTTIFNISYTMLFVYSTDLVSGGCWICYRGYDGNTNTIGYQLRTNSGNLVASDTGHKYRLWFTSADGKKWVPINTSTSDNATTSRTLNTRAIDPFGAIVYNSANGTVSSGSKPAVTALWQQYTLTIGYSYVKTLTAWNPVFLKCLPNTNGSAVMKDIVQSLPSSNDGFIYIFLGTAYSSTAIELNVNHPVYYHDGIGIRLWTGKTIPTKTSELTNDGNGTSAFATMADIGGLGGGTITGVKTTAGAHTTIDVSSGNASFNVPTKTSHLTNDSGFITSYTDEKVKRTLSTTSNTYYPLQSDSTEAVSTANTLNGISFYQYYNTAGGYRRLNLGNSTAYKATGGAYGTIRLYGSAATYYGDLVPGVLGTTSGDGHISANRTWTLPDKTGTIALTSDIPSVPTITLNGSTTTSPSFYAPTSAGTNGYILKSNGSGSPSWVAAPDLTDYVDWASLNSEAVPTTFTNDTISFDWNDTSYNSASQNVQWALETIINEIDNIGDAKVDSNTLASIATSGSYNDLLNANWLNGSATGSVRTSSSGPESSSYTIGQYATTEGYDTFAYGLSSHAEGAMTVARGSSAHSEGTYTSADGNNSHVSGYWTRAQRASQTVIGEYNVLDTAGTTTTRGDYVFIIGNGTANARSNALAVKWDGTVETAKGNLSGVQIIRW